MRFAYADPPYPGQAKRHYGDQPDYGGEVDHAELIARLVADYPDGWALSTSSTCLRELLPMCPAEHRIGAWTKGFAVFHCNPAYAWEPVIFCGGRPRKGHDRNEITVRDWVMAHPPCYRGKGLGVRGQKPEEFCHWIFAMLGLRPADTFDDLFPGTGAVTCAWRAWSGRPPEAIHEQAALAIPPGWDYLIGDEAPGGVTDRDFRAEPVTTGDSGSRYDTVDIEHGVVTDREVRPETRRIAGQIKERTE